MSAVYTLGIDVGSTASKCIILKDGKEIVAKSLIDVGAGTSGPQRAIDAVLEAAGMTRDQMAYVLATGYGRNSLMGLADKQMSELSCHARGASFLFPEAHTVIDIGGQDVKVLRIENGTMTNFQMNDKCAAGTGRFLGSWRGAWRIWEIWEPSRRSMWASAPHVPYLQRARLSASSPWVRINAISSTASITPWLAVWLALPTGSAW